MLTSSLAEPNIFKLAVSLPVIFISSTMLEALWSAREILTYICFSCGVPGLVLFVVRYIGSVFVSSDTVTRPVCGAVGLLITLLIGVRHAFPIKEVVNLNKFVPSMIQGLLPARGLVQARHLPFLCLSTEVILASFFPSYFPEWPLAPLAYISAWVYIRYLMHFPYANLRGDHSTEFQFSVLFPKAIRSSLDKMFGIFYLVVHRFTDAFELRPSDKTSLAATISLYSPADAAAANAVMEAIGTEKFKFEERRAKALKFLDENIAALIGRNEPVEDSLRLVESPKMLMGKLTASEIAEV
jgi:hypothetical protein